jgi:hypothetical protein
MRRCLKTRFSVMSAEPPSARPSRPRRRKPSRKAELYAPPVDMATSRGTDSAKIADRLSFPWKLFPQDLIRKLLKTLPANGANRMNLRMYPESMLFWKRIQKKPL